MVIKEMLIYFYVCILVSNIHTFAFRLVTSSSRAIVGESFTISCTSTNPVVRFVMNGSSVCVIAGVHENGSCLLAGFHLEQYAYTCDKTQNMYNVTIPGSAVEAIHKSQWKCYDPFGGGESNTVYVYVNVPVKLLTLKSTSENENIIIVSENVLQNIECYTNAIRPPITIQWYLSNDTISSSASSGTSTCNTGCTDDKLVSSSILHYTFARSDNGKSLYCTASNVEGYMAVSSNVKRIEVLYGPLDIILSPSKNSYIVRENDSIGPITCESLCNPPCTHIWAGLGLKAMTSNLMIHQITRHQTGTFYCTSENVIGSYQINIDITVQYGADVTYVAISGGSLTVVDNSDITLSCTAIGEPVPNLAWYFTNQNQSTRLQMQNATNHSTFQIVNSKCKDTGQYSCTADNLIFPSSTKTVNLNVTCVPRGKRSCSTNTSIEIEIHSYTSIYTCWIANPAPDVRWRLISGDNITKATSIQKITSTVYRSILQTRFVAVGLIVFEVVASNSYGTSEPVVYSISVNDTSVQSVETYSDKNKNTLISLSTISCVAVVIAVLVLVFLRYKKKEAEESTDSGTSREYTEFRSYEISESISYDTLHPRINDLNAITDNSAYEDIYHPVQDPKDTEKEITIYENLKV